MRNLLDSRSSTQVSTENKRSLSIKRLGAISFQAKELYIHVSKFTEIISEFLAHAHTHLREVLKNNSGRTEGHFNIILFCFPV